MDDALRKSSAAKSAALAFIIQIILGNIWMADAVVGKKSSGLLIDSMLIVSAWILLSGVWLVITKLRFIREEKSSSHSGEEP